MTKWITKMIVSNVQWNGCRKKSNIINKNADISFSAHDTFLEQYCTFSLKFSFQVIIPVYLTVCKKSALQTYQCAILFLFLPCGI